MVAVAQLVRASDCGSEGRGFETHQPPGDPDALGRDFYFNQFLWPGGYFLFLLHLLLAAGLLSNYFLLYSFARKIRNLSWVCIYTEFFRLNNQQ